MPLKQFTSLRSHRRSIFLTLSPWTSSSSMFTAANTLTDTSAMTRHNSDTTYKRRLVLLVEALRLSTTWTKDLLTACNFQRDLSTPDTPSIPAVINHVSVAHQVNFTHPEYTRRVFRAFLIGESAITLHYRSSYPDPDSHVASQVHPSAPRATPKYFRRYYGSFQEHQDQRVLQRYPQRLKQANYKRQTRSTRGQEQGQESSRPGQCPLG